MAEYTLPEENRYSKHDEWMRKEDDGSYLLGVTDYAQQELGDVVFVELPAVGSRFAAGDSFGVIESVKAVSDLYCPVGGEVVRVNETLEDEPEAVNEDCYGRAWIIALRAGDEAEVAGLMDAAAYRKYIEERSD